MTETELRTLALNIVTDAVAADPQTAELLGHPSDYAGWQIMDDDGHAPFTVRSPDESRVLFVQPADSMDSMHAAPTPSDYYLAVTDGWEDLRHVQRDAGAFKVSYTN